MLMYTPMLMKMDGSRIGRHRVSPEDIVTTIPNRFGPLSTLRNTPEEMSMEMHMFGAMCCINDSITVMLMTSYVEKRMSMITFQGGMGTTRLGITEGSTEGIADTSVSVAFKLWQGHGGDRLNGTLGVSLPTGSIEERGRMLTPMGMMMEMRSAYGMQLGTGTYDLLPSLTYLGSAGRLGWGAQMKARIALENENDEGYRWGDLYEATAWLSYELADVCRAPRALPPARRTKSTELIRRLAAPSRAPILSTMEASASRPSSSSTVTLRSATEPWRASASKRACRSIRTRTGRNSNATGRLP
jgi:hypothetical protein